MKIPTIKHYTITFILLVISTNAFSQEEYIKDRTSKHSFLIGGGIGKLNSNSTIYTSTDIFYIFSKDGNSYFTSAGYSFEKYRFSLDCNLGYKYSSFANEYLLIKLGTNVPRKFSVNLNLQYFEVKLTPYLIFHLPNYKKLKFGLTYLIARQFNKSHHKNIRISGNPLTLGRPDQYSLYYNNHWTKRIGVSIKLEVPLKNKKRAIVYELSRNPIRQFGSLVLSTENSIYSLGHYNSFTETRLSAFFKF